MANTLLDRIPMTARVEREVTYRLPVGTDDTYTNLDLSNGRVFGVVVTEYCAHGWQVTELLYCGELGYYSAVLQSGQTAVWLRTRDCEQPPTR